MILEIKSIKKLVRTVGVKSWVEAGVDVVRKGDSWLDNGSRKNGRLDCYDKNKHLFFVKNEKLCRVPCGRIELNDGAEIYYNII